ncbi:hypothetical protein [Roseobacter weihaiensis]|uniref:hypothetical protein n=1 Tax=Roseobacter weihaiensis TaxID=2763262 RepID=UPI001D0B149D|nr:hypothetical protein [Roseobacter sp. H9]
MSDLTLTKTTLRAGIWEGLVLGAAATPALSVTHLDKAVEGVTLLPTKENGAWVLTIPIPAEAISDGIQTLLITDTSSGATLDKITLLAGDTLADDLRAEVDLLRAELDMLKRAFRRHCLETEAE